MTLQIERLKITANVFLPFLGILGINLGMEMIVK
jgi:hypothetical protein